MTKFKLRRKQYYSKLMALTKDGLICRKKGCNDNAVFSKRNNNNKVKVTNYPTQKEYNNWRSV
jgi:hypothetical protein